MANSRLLLYDVGLLLLGVWRLQERDWNCVGVGDQDGGMESYGTNFLDKLSIRVERIGHLHVAVRILQHLHLPTFSEIDYASTAGDLFEEAGVTSWTKPT